MTPSPPAVRLRGVSKAFGRHTAVDRLDLEIEPGGIYGLLGPNGSGKTTTLRMIMGILRPDGGSAELFGRDPADVRRQEVGYLPEERGLYRRMRVLDVLLFLAEIRGVARRDAEPRARGWLRRLGLEGWWDRRVEDLSKGMQQKVQFVGTVLHEPSLLVLDEPFSGLDPINQDLLEEIVLEFRARGATVLLSTHLMDQAERLCERVCLLSGGKAVLEGDLRSLRVAERTGVVVVDFQGDEGWLSGPEVASVERRGDGLHLMLHPGADAGALLRRAVEAEVELRRFERVEPRLHEIFVRHAGGGSGAVAEGAR